jgi:hypothetical protein
MGAGRALGPYFKYLFSWPQSSLVVGIELILASFAYPIIHLIKIYINLREKVFIVEKKRSVQ